MERRNWHTHNNLIEPLAGRCAHSKLLQSSSVWFPGLYHDMNMSVKLIQPICILTALFKNKHINKVFLHSCSICTSEWQLILSSFYKYIIYIKKVNVHDRFFFLFFVCLFRILFVCCCLLFSSCVCVCSFKMTRCHTRRSHDDYQMKQLRRMSRFSNENIILCLKRRPRQAKKGNKSSLHNGAQIIMPTTLCTECMWTNVK